jgi:VCBS repeat protein
MPILKMFGLALLACLWANNSWAQSDLSFTRHDISPGTSTGPRQSATGDFNGDSQVDLAIGTAPTATSPATVLMLLGTGDGDFQAAPSVTIGAEPSSIVVADFNNDGRQDLAAASFAGNAVFIRLGNGDGTFQVAPDVSAAGGLLSAVAGHFNGDGATDLAVSVFLPDGQSNVRIYVGNGDGTFSQGQEIVEGTPRAITLGDFNGDGRQDVAAINFLFEHNSVIILLGQGDGTFGPPGQEFAVGPEASSLTVGDFNGDGQQDVATADANTDVVSVLLGNGEGTFEAARHFPPGVPPAPGSLVQPVSIKVGDFNGDGHQDLATGNRRPSDPPIESGVSILLGRGDGTFEPAQEFPTGTGTESLAVADFNNDGRMDLATANHETSTVSVLINDSSAEALVQIDIKPADPRNRINLRNNASIRVAVLTRGGFDATDVDPTTVRFGRSGTEAAPIHFALKDVDRDGNTDIVLRFKTRRTGIACGDTTASLSGKTFGGQRIKGADFIRTVGCKRH